MSPSSQSLFPKIHCLKCNSSINYKSLRYNCYKTIICKMSLICKTCFSRSTCKNSFNKHWLKLNTHFNELNLQNKLESKSNFDELNNWIYNWLKLWYLLNKTERLPLNGKEQVAENKINSNDWDLIAFNLKQCASSKTLCFESIELEQKLSLRGLV